METIRALSCRHGDWRRSPLTAAQCGRLRLWMTTEPAAPEARRRFRILTLSSKTSQVVATIEATSQSAAGTLGRQRGRYRCHSWRRKGCSRLGAHRAAHQRRQRATLIRTDEVAEPFVTTILPPASSPHSIPPACSVKSPVDVPHACGVANRAAPEGPLPSGSLHHIRADPPSHMPGPQAD